MAQEDGFNHCQVSLSTGRTYHYVDQQPKQDKPAATLLCIHGFPDLWYGWRHQINPWVEAGYRVVVPDMLGYGKTDMPLEASAYTSKSLCNDLVALLDHLGVQKAVVIGHDWGSFTVGRFALWYPERLLALAMLSVPYSPPPTQQMSVNQLAQRFPIFGYQVYLTSEGSAAEIEANLASFLRLLYGAPGQGKVSWLRAGELQEHLRSGTVTDGCLLNDKELDYYVSHFQRGMTGPLSYYHSTNTRFEEEQTLSHKLPADLPVLFVYGTEDVTCPQMAVKIAHSFIDQLKVVPVSGAGHWVMVEAPQTVTEEILQWLRSVLEPKAPSSL